MAEPYFSLSDEDRAEVLELGRERTGRPAHLLEKDVWVVSPPEAAARISREIGKLMNEPEMRKRVTDMGANIAVNTPEAETRRVKDEIEKWRRAVTAAGVKLDQ